MKYTVFVHLEENACDGRKQIYQAYFSWNVAMNIPFYGDKQGLPKLKFLTTHGTKGCYFMYKTQMKNVKILRYLFL